MVGRHAATTTPVLRRAPGRLGDDGQFQAAYPFLGMGGPSAYVGTDAFGGAWAFDPWELYARRIMRSPNVIVLAGISYAKSDADQDLHLSSAPVRPAGLGDRREG
jgi:hypothetical protein